MRLQLIGVLGVALLVMVPSDAHRDKLNKLQLTILYESKCSDSIRFVTSQLQPAYQKLNKYISLKFVPFGHANQIPGTTSFTCQHGATECLGNVIQNCALYQMRGRSHQDVLDYVACELSQQLSPNGNFGCVERARLSPQRVMQCAQAQEGYYLQLASEKETNNVDHSFIPTVTVNGVFIQEFQDLAQYDLIEAICSLLRDEGVPECI